MIRKKRKKLLLLAGALYVIFGVLAFFDIPGGHEEHHHTFAHNLTHVVLGMLLLGITLKSPPRIRRAACFLFAAGYLILGAYGASLEKTFTIAIVPGIIEFHAGDYGVHFATAFVFLLLGLLKRSDRTLTH